MDVYEAAVTRRSIRRFREKPVPYEILEKCVEAARLAPSARNHQVCEYIIVDEAGLLPQVFASILSWGGVPAAKSAPPPRERPGAYIVSLANKTIEESFGAGQRRVTIYDAGMAAENIMLVAAGNGIGTCPILMYNEKGLKQALRIPDNYDVVLLTAMGYPDESPVAEEAAGSVALRIDEQGVRHVPKRKLADICRRNSF